MSYQIILGIETSCDDTSMALIKNGREVLSNVVSSQIAVHQPYGGVVPEIASRHHLENITYVCEVALKEAELDFSAVDAIAVTYGPGLVGSLLVGVSYAKALAYALQKPLIPVHHMEGHLYAAFLEHGYQHFPLLALIVSGGHTMIVVMHDHGRYEILGSTRDDAAGEAFDKISRVLGLGYPGGPFIQKLALQGDEEAIKFPRALTNEDNYEFSFSGLKSSVINYLHNAEQKGQSISKPDVAASFQKAVVDVLVEKALRAAKSYDIKYMVIAGGVAANAKLRDELLKACQQNNIKVHFPDFNFCTDNAAMIACAAYFTAHYQNPQDYLSLNAVPYQPLPKR